MARRLLALAGAVALVAAALVIRDRLDGDGAGASGSSQDDGGVRTVACITELADVCRAWDAQDDTVEVVVEDAGDTEAKLVAGEADVDAWLTLDPWPGVVSVAAPGEVGDDERLASSPLVIVAVTRDFAAVPCDPIGWRCVADNGLRAAVPPPDTALGLVALGHAASGWFGRSDFASNDFVEPGFLEWIGDVRREPNPLTKLVRELPAAFVSAVASTKLAIDQGALGAKAGQVTVVNPEPAGHATVVLAPVGQADIEVPDVLRTALADAGWGDPVDDSGLPAAGVLVALRAA